MTDHEESERERNKESNVFVVAFASSVMVKTTEMVTIAES
jgi:hypothetical protein